MGSVQADADLFAPKAIARRAPSKNGISQCGDEKIDELVIFRCKLLLMSK